MNPFKKLVGSAFSPSNKRQLTLGKVPFSETALFTNIIATGAIGSGKTAAFIKPILDKFSNLFKNEDHNASDAKWGGFILDIKGDLHEAVIYSMQKHGRDVLQDLVVVRPDNDYTVVEFEDVHTGHHFLVSAIGGTSNTECDKVLAQAAGSPQHLTLTADNEKWLSLTDGSVEPLTAWMFVYHGSISRPEVQAGLKELEFVVQGQDIKWLGWRAEDGKLARVTHTQHKAVQFAKGADGKKIYTEVPRVVKYVGYHTINNGLTYNLISEQTTGHEAASRLMAVAEVTGNSMGSDNLYWANAAEKHIANCIELVRQVDTNHQCSINDIQKMTTDDFNLEQLVQKLAVAIAQKQQQGSSNAEVLLLRNVYEYFIAEWSKLDHKSKGNIMSCVTTLFGDVTRNQQLIKTFCQPSSFTFNGCMQDGKVYMLMLSAYPNAQKLIGTSMKLDFQKTVLKRTDYLPVNKTRPLLFLADEYQFFLTTTGVKGLGDDKFLSLARQLRTCNIVCTQAITSLLAVQKDEQKINAFLQCFGSRIFFQTLDVKTSNLAGQMENFLKQGKKQEVCTSTSLLQPTLHTTSFSSEEEAEIQAFIAKYGSRLKIKQPMFETQTLDEIWSTRNPIEQYQGKGMDYNALPQLQPFEAIIFNKENKPQMVKTDLRPDALFYSPAETKAMVNSYYQAYLENRLHELGMVHLLDTTAQQWPQHPSLDNAAKLSRAEGQ